MKLQHLFGKVRRSLIWVAYAMCASKMPEENIGNPACEKVGLLLDRGTVVG